jgi:hypothetical protein
VNLNQEYMTLALQELVQHLCSEKKLELGLSTPIHEQTIQQIEYYSHFDVLIWLSPSLAGYIVLYTAMVMKNHTIGN